MSKLQTILTRLFRFISTVFVILKAIIEVLKNNDENDDPPELKSPTTIP